MSRLKDRTRQVPNGMFFYQPETKWRSTPWASFNVIVEEVIQHRLGNPHLTQKHGRPTDRAAVEAEVDAFIAHVCDAMGWDGFTVGNEGSPAPKMSPPSQEEISKLSAAGAKAKLIYAGVRTLNDWLDSGEPPVPQAQSESRAQTCSACPLNGPGDFTAWFTKPAAEAIKRQIERLEERKLTTTVDDKLGVCSACLCPLRLKAHSPLKFIKAHIKDEVIDKLRQGKNCWILSELAAS